MEKAINQNGNVVFHPQVKTYLQPRICEEFEEDGDLHYRLDNGRETLASAYNTLWNPIKGKVNFKSKGSTIESPQRKY